MTNNNMLNIVSLGEECAVTAAFAINVLSSSDMAYLCPACGNRQAMSGTCRHCRESEVRFNPTINHLDAIARRYRDLHFLCESEDIPFVSILNATVEGATEFTITLEDDSEYRFIHEDLIHGILVEELKADNYLLGSFKSDFLATVTGLDASIFTALQDANAYEGIGKLLKGLGCIDRLASLYVHADGYGNHFASYDCEENLVETPLGWLYVFRIN